MNRIFTTAGIVIVVGMLLMAVGQVLFSSNSSTFWKYNYGPFDQQAAEGKKRDTYTGLFNLGLIIVGLGLAIIAFGLAMQRPPPAQFREVPSHISLEQYPQPPQPPKSP